MKLVPSMVALLLSVGCAGNPASDTGPVARCEVTDCFYERDIRDFEVVNRTTMVVYVGPQRCPFVVELDGFDCDVAFAPQILFLQGALGRIDQATAVRSGEVCGSTGSLYLYSGILEPGLLGPDSRLDPVTGRRTGLGGLGRPGPGDFGDPVPIDTTSGDLCRVQDVRSVNDDQLVELYVEEGVTAPPPPVGTGELEVPEPQAEQGSAVPGPDQGQDRPAADAPTEGSVEEGAEPGSQTEAPESP